MDQQIPFEVVMDRARRDIVQFIEQVGNQYSIPSGILVIMLEQIVKDSKIAAYESVFGSLNLNQQPAPAPIQDDIPPEESGTE